MLIVLCLSRNFVEYTNIEYKFYKVSNKQILKKYYDLWDQPTSMWIFCEKSV